MEITEREISSDARLPLVIEPQTAAPSQAQTLAWLRTHAESVQAALYERGGVLLRGFAMTDEASFREVANALLPELLPYMEGQSPRTRLMEGVYTSTEYPSRFDITLHSELSYVTSPPPRLIFGCLVAATSGGETPIVDCRTVYSKLPAELRDKFETKGIRYVKNMRGGKQGVGKTWQGHFETSDRSVVEKYLSENAIDFRWLDDGSLWTSQQRPAMRVHPVTGERVWGNQSNLWHLSNFDARTRAHLLKYHGEEGLPTHAYFGDGTPIEDEELDRVRKVMWDNASIFPWEEGDVLVLDNILVAHGRTAYEGPRKIVVAMG